MENYIIFTFWYEMAILLGTILILTYAYCKYQMSWWRRKGGFSVPGSFPFGSVGAFLTARRSVGEVFADIYTKGKGQPYVGYYTFSNPSLLIRDPELIKKIWVKDFNHFSDRGFYSNEEEDPLSAHIFALSGTRWRNLRTKISSAFTSGKMKFMYGTMTKCARQLTDYIEEISEDETTIDFKDIIAKHGINVIANTAIGIEGHSFKSDSDLSRITFKVTEPTFVQSIRFTLPMISKNFAQLLKLRFTPKVVENYFMDITEKIVKYRKQSQTRKGDFMQLLIELGGDIVNGEDNNCPKENNCNGKETSEGMTLRDIAAQTFVFVLAAYETTSVTVCYVLYELAMHLDMQDRLLAEIDAEDADISYEKLHELTYLDMVLNEIWRKYPPAPFIFRENLEEYTLPDGLVIPPETKVTVSLLGLHNDPKWFPNPEKFDPERFSKDSPSQTIHPFSYLPFGEGPRFCIGTRFAKMQAKVTLYEILRHYRVHLDKKTQIPPTYEPKTFMLNPAGGMYLRLKKR